MVMQIGDSGKSGADEICRVRLIVATLTADPVEEFTTKSELRHQVDWLQQPCQVQILESGGEGGEKEGDQWIG